MQGGSPHTQEDTPHEEESEESIEAVENLLESYFMQIDSLYDRLVSMGALSEHLLCLETDLELLWIACCVGAKFLALLSTSTVASCNSCPVLGVPFYCTVHADLHCDFYRNCGLSKDVIHRSPLKPVDIVLRSPHLNAGEYIKDTEEYINIELDSSRNRLIRLEIVLTAGTFAVAIWGLVGSEMLPHRLLSPDCCFLPGLLPTLHAPLEQLTVGVLLAF